MLSKMSASPLPLGGTMVNSRAAYPSEFKPLGRPRNSPVGYLVTQNGYLEYEERRCGFNTKHRSTNQLSGKWSLSFRNALQGGAGPRIGHGRAGWGMAGWVRAG